MKAIVLAYHTIGCEGIEALLRHGFEVAAVFTHRDNPGENLWFRSVAELAAARGIPVFAPDDINHPLWVERIRALQPDIIFSFYYRQIVKREILAIPRGGCLNLHGSLLPKYRGRCPVNWVLINGEEQTGVTLHHMTPRPDDGDIVGQIPVPITPEDTALTLHERLALAARDLLDAQLPAIRDGQATRTPQDHLAASYFGGRGPEDGRINWTQPASAVRNLIRAVTQPYPGAFSVIGGRTFYFWQGTVVAGEGVPGTILNAAPLTIACGKDALQVDFGQAENGIYLDGTQLAQQYNLVTGARFSEKRQPAMLARKPRVLILGVNGFIGNALTERLLASGRWEVHGMDLQADRVARFRDDPSFHFDECDISIHREWLEYHIRKCDVILPLIAIATPMEYTRNPLRVFELDFEENLRVVRYCAKYGKRLLFPSTSEVYGMCGDEAFDEENSPLVLGPIRMQRWIYSCSKQMLDRVIWAYGDQRDLRFSLFRPFNWIGPRLDRLSSARIGSSRVITQLILNLVEGTPIQLVDGGAQKRCFTDVSDGVECLFRLIEDRNQCCNKRIVNIGAPENEASIRELAEMLVAAFDVHPLRKNFPPFAGFQEIDSGTYYGKGYQDIQRRRPSIRNAQKLLDWSPKVEMEAAVMRTLDFFLREEALSLIGKTEDAEDA